MEKNLLFYKKKLSILIVDFDHGLNDKEANVGTVLAVRHIYQSRIKFSANLVINMPLCNKRCVNAYLKFGQMRLLFQRAH